MSNDLRSDVLEFEYGDIPVAAVLESLKDRGLHVVTAADKAVLDAMGVVTEAALRDQLDNGSGSLPGACRAELARRKTRP